MESKKIFHKKEMKLNCAGEKKEKIRRFFISLIFLLAPFILYHTSVLFSAGNDENTYFLLQSEDPDDTTVFTDVSISGNGGAGHSISGRLAGAQSGPGVHHETNVAKFGNSSIQWDGSDDWLTVSDHDDFYFTGDFTIDLWVRFANWSPTHQGIWSQGMDADGMNRTCLMWNETDDCIQFIVSNATTTICNLKATSTTIALNTWYHIACVRSGSDFYLFINGNKKKTGVSAAACSNIAYPFYGGLRHVDTVSNTQLFDGYQEEIRISRVARWTDNFEVPPNPFNDRIAYHMYIKKGANFGGVRFYRRPFD